VLLFFYPKDNTPGCTKEACSFRDHWRAFQQLNVAILGVSIDDEQSHQSFAKKYALLFTLLANPEKALVQAYGAWGEKSLYGKKYMGIDTQRSRALAEALSGRTDGSATRYPTKGHRHHRAAPGRAIMPPSSNTRRSSRTAVRIFVLLFVAMVVGFYLTVGPDLVDLRGVRSLFVILAVLLLIGALFFVK
jgi:hypothetical protein